MGNPVDEKDYDRLIEPIKKQMIRSIWKIIRDTDDAEEVLQESFEKIWKNIKTIRKHPSPHALILKICINTSCDFLRKKVRTQKHYQEPSDRGALCNSEQNHAISKEVLAELYAHDVKVEIDKAIVQLPKRQAEAVLMRFIQEQSYRDIALSMKCSETTVRTHIERAREKLQQLLAHLEISPIS